MTDLDGARRTYLMLRNAGTKGVHSREIIAAKFPGCTNPSQRLREIADHVEVRKVRENVGRSPGIRAWLAEYAPDDSTPVTPHSGSGRSHDPLSSEGVMEQPPPVVVPPSADVEGGGGIEGEPAQATGTPLSAEPLSWCWSKQTGWVQRPVREVLAGWERRAA